MAIPINASLAASGALNEALSLDTQTNINFGAGIIDNPNAFTPTQAANPVATSALGNAGGSAPSSNSAPGTFGGLSFQTVEILVVGIGGLAILAAVAWHFRK